ncbi:hypothetical protein ACTA71_006382 [Dictyostelium dimigraforme]
MITDKLPNSKIEIRYILYNLTKKDIDVKLTVNSKNVFETIKDDLNTEFKKVFIIDYYDDEPQTLCFEVLNAKFVTSLDECLPEPGKVIIGDLMTEEYKSIGKIEIFTLVTEYTNDYITLGFEAVDVDAKDLNGKSDPYFKIYKSSSNGASIFVYQSKVIKKTLNPKWDLIHLPISFFNNGDMYSELTIHVYDWDKIGKHDLIGTVILDTNRIIEGEREFQIINLKKASKKGQHSGIFKCYKFNIENKSTLQEYIVGGCDISLTFAIDCSSSNGELPDSKSLHANVLSGSMSLYTEAILDIGGPIKQLSNKGITALGFGAICPGESIISHCFPISLDNDQFEKDDQYEINNDIDDNMAKLKMSEPTNFSDIIQYSMKQSTIEEIDQDNQKYSILVIFTDGLVSDIDETIKNVTISSSLPLSIIIIQIGKGSPSTWIKMEKLKDYYINKERLYQLNVNKPTRNILHCIHFAEYIPNQLFEKDIYDKIQNQLVEYFLFNKIKPKEGNIAPDINSDSD